MQKSKKLFIVVSLVINSFILFNVGQILAQNSKNTSIQLGMWEIQHTFDSSYWLTDIQTIKPDEVWVVGSELYGDRDNWIDIRSTPISLKYKQGVWSNISVPSPPQVDDMCSGMDAIDMLDSDAGWALGRDDSGCDAYLDDGDVTFIVYYKNGQWIRVGSQPREAVYDISGLDDQNVWTSGAYGISHYNDNIWVDELSTMLFGEDIDILSSNDGWVVGNGIRHYDGNTWTTITDTNKFLSIDMLSINDGWAVGSGGEILHYNGINWKPTISPVTETLTSVSMTEIGQGFAVGDNGTILYYDGVSWMQMQSPVKENFETVSAILGDDGFIYAWALANNSVLHYVGKPVPDPVSTTISPLGGELVFNKEGHNTKLIFPPNAVSMPTPVTYTYRLPMRTDTLVGIDYFFQLTTTENNTNTVQFNLPITIVTRYSEQQLVPVISNTLQLYWLDDSSWLTSSIISAHNGNVITSTTSHFTVFAILGQTNHVYLPFIMKN